MDLIKDLPHGEQYVIVKLSGGADSSIVYYAVCDKFKDRNDVKIVVITLDTDFKNQYIASAKRIIQIVGSLTGKYPIDHITNTVKHNNRNYVDGQEQLSRLAHQKYPITILYSGLTKNIPPNKMKKFVKSNFAMYNINRQKAFEAIDSRDKARDRDFEFSPFESKGLVFSKHDKNIVADAYRHYDMIEKLYPYTFSCETPPFKFKNGMPVHCGRCFFCLERWYAFGRIT